MTNAFPYVLSVTTVVASSFVPSASYDLNTVSQITGAELAPYMSKYSRHLSEDVVRICKEYGVSAEFIATVMRWEGRPDLHNWFGWMGTNGLMRFDSDVECLEYCISAIKRLYLDPEGKYYNGATVEGVSIWYNNSDFWRETIQEGTMHILEATQTYERLYVFEAVKGSEDMRVRIIETAERITRTLKDRED